MEMSQRIHSMISNFTGNNDFLKKMAKKSHFGKNNSWTAYKTQFELKMLKLLENQVKTKF